MAKEKKRYDFAERTIETLETLEGRHAEITATLRAALDLARNLLARIRAYERLLKKHDIPIPDFEPEPTTEDLPTPKH